MLAVVWLSVGLSQPYWYDPRIHNIGNGRLHAGVARFATRAIDILSYDGRDVRQEILKQYVPDGSDVVDLCCGVGASTAADGVGVDTSSHMIREARRRPGDRRFEEGNAETFGVDDGASVVTLFFALHEMPPEARVRVMKNALRVARDRVIVCDISPRKRPSALMLSGEPYLVDYQSRVVHELMEAADGRPHVLTEAIAGHVLLCIIDLPNERVP